MAKVAVSIDNLVKKAVFRSRLARECARLSPAEEQEMAEECITKHLAEWPEY